MVNRLFSSHRYAKSPAHLLAFSIASLLVFCCPTLYSQTLSSSIRGTITDVTGAVAANVEVTVTDIKTGVKVRAVVSDTDGNYEVPDLTPAVYKITAEAPGFKSYVADNVVVEGSQIRRVNVTLEV